MKVVCISDTHTREPELPDGDILVHAGDALSVGTDNEWYRFLRWMQKQRQYKHIFYVPGNHDVCVYKLVHLRQQEAADYGVTMLVDQLWEKDDLRVYGSPWVPYINGRWAFEGDQYDDEDLLRKFSGIWQLDSSCGEPKKEILITHSPPKGILDEGQHHFGSEQLLEVVLRVKPDLHVFGHVHESYGIREFNRTKFVNAAVLNRRYELVNSPIEIEL